MAVKISVARARVKGTSYFRNDVISEGLSKKEEETLVKQGVSEYVHGIEQKNSNESVNKQKSKEEKIKDSNDTGDDLKININPDELIKEEKSNTKRKGK